jgi:type I restriction enzyme S subunit
MQNDCFPEVPPEWDKGPISMIADINPRYPVKKGQELPFIEMAAVAEQFGGIQRMDWRKLEGSGLARFKAGDTLFAKITPCPENGKVAFVHELPSPYGIGSTEFIVLSPKANCDPRYLYHLVCAHAVRGRAASRMEGSTGRQRVPDDVFEKRLLVPIPPPEEQASISAFLDSLDDTIAKLLIATERAKDNKKALRQRLFSEGTRREQRKKSAVGMIPKSWTVDTVKSVVSEFQYGLSVPMQTSGTLPILRMGNIQAGDVLLSDLKFVTLAERVTKPYMLNRGDVLFNRTNSQELVGKVGIYRHDEPCVFASYLIRLKPNAEQVDNYYLGQLLDSYDAQCRIKRYATPGVQQVNINATNLGKVLIPVPVGETGLDEQREIAAILEQADETIRAFGPKLKALHDLKKSLLHDLLTGAVRVKASLSQVAEAV